jgi:hypothetical protein
MSPTIPARDIPCHSNEVSPTVLARGVFYCTIPARGVFYYSGQRRSLLFQQEGSPTVSNYSSNRRQLLSQPRCRLLQTS